MKILESLNEGILHRIYYYTFKLKIENKGEIKTYHFKVEISDDGSDIWVWDDGNNELDFDKTFLGIEYDIWNYIHNYVEMSDGMRDESWIEFNGEGFE